MRKKTKDMVNPGQLSLFEMLKPESQHLGPGAYDIENRLKEEASAGLRKCRYSRYEVAAKMSEMLGQEVTKTMLDNRTAESKENHYWPAAWLAPYAAITGHYEQIKIINKLAKFPVADTEKLVDMELARRKLIIEEEQKEIEDLLRIKGMINNQKKGDE